VEPLTRSDYLFRRSTDPGQTENLWAAEPAQRERMLSLVRELIDQEGAPPEQLERLGLQ
jgi:hypothetical protein